MFRREEIDNITDWAHVDFFCMKSKHNKIATACYYMDGHQVFEEELTQSDREFIVFTKDHGCYGSSEKIMDSKTDDDRFYVRVNVKDDLQQTALIDYLLQMKVLSSEQKYLINFLASLDIVVTNQNDYRALYYCGFVQGKNLKTKGIRFYFKTFGADESILQDEACFEYLERCLHFKHDPAFRVAKKLSVQGLSSLRSIGIEFIDDSSFKVKYYLRKNTELNSIQAVLNALSTERMFEQQVQILNKCLPVVSDMACNLIQVTSGFCDGDESVSMYIEPTHRASKMFYSLKEGLVIRDICGVTFLVDINEKHYYDIKNLFTVNETGRVIIEYLISHRVSNVDGIVSHLRTKIINYSPELYPVLCEDCKNFVELLKENGYLLEVV